VRPQIKQHILPFGLLVAAIVCGGISWAVEGTTFYVLVGLSFVLLVAGVVLAMRLESARRDKQ
jgi:hypothetical protein